MSFRKSLFVASVVALVVTLAACGSKKSSSQQSDKPIIVGAVPARSPMATPKPTVAKAVEPPPAPPKTLKPPPAKKRLYSKWVRSLRLRRSISVRIAPREKAKKLGTVSRGTRVRWKSATRNRDCPSRWIEIEPQGWVCERYLAPSKEAAFARELPRLKRGEVLPGQYGKVIVDKEADEDTKAKTYSYKNKVLKEKRELEGSVTVRLYGEKVIDEKSYWHIGGREYLPVENVRTHKPSKFRGIRLGDDTGMVLPLGFVMSRKNYGHRVVVYKTSKLNRPVRRLKARAIVSVLERVAKKNDKSHAYRIGDDEWVKAGEIHVARKVAPPPLTLSTERWFDVDLTEQVMVAYEGTTPVYTTMVSTGVRKHPTIPGIFRIWLKFSETDMSGQMDDEAPYSVATVPWTQYYAKDFALHTAYWHDVFGLRKSHGCVNLTPLDSRFFYFWSDPQVPSGWTMANGVTERPGSMVRVHSRQDPNPEFQGYAKEVYEARKAAAASSVADSAK